MMNVAKLINLSAQKQKIYNRKIYGEYRNMLDNQMLVIDDTFTLDSMDYLILAKE